MKLFYTFLLWATSLELAIAKSAPVRNQRHIEALQKDESDYQAELIQLELNV
jgi:hypothetical protein